MDKNRASELINEGLFRGADFVEIFIEETTNSSIQFKDKKVESSLQATDFGIGLRLIFGTEVFYAHTGNDSAEYLKKVIHSLADTRENVPKISERTINTIQEISIPKIQNVRTNPLSVSPSKKVELLKLVDEKARKFSNFIAQVSVSANSSSSNILIINSDGIWVKDLRIRSRFSLSVTSERNGERFVATESPGAMLGYEFFEQLQWEELVHSASERSVKMLEAGYITGKKMPVIMGNAFGGVIFHEACGHPLETEAIRKNASTFTGKLGQKIAHESVTAIDDGTIQNSWGSLSVDDEGMETQKTVLIENGILKNYISDKIGSMEVGVPRTGSARRESYQFAPVSRMRNTYIDRGKHKVHDMIASVGDGLYAKKMGGGSVNPATGEFNFAVEEGYIIKNGKISQAVRGATLIGKGHEILPKISMVGDDLELAAGMCGASSGSVPVTVGQPTIKVDEILVGGR